MTCYHQDLNERKKYLIASLHNEVANLGDMWFKREINDQQYRLLVNALDERIAELQM